MRLAAVTIICCLFLSVGLAQQNQTYSLQPTPLEAFAGRPTARVTWSKLIGSLESQESRATITAIIVEDKTSKPSVMRGIRVSLAHVGPTPSCDWKYTAWKIMCQRANAAVYIEEERLESVRNRIKLGAAQLRSMEFISQYRMIAPGREATGLMVCGYKFSDRQPEDLAELFTRAIGELKAIPRGRGAA
ncbi:MAG TPA: hypothetical protein VFM05_02670 [Candidatus Saccharimonadales bacterium]|nr:hypothetical protein [Candidatus Saccharimonadales bacterium]